MMFKQKNRSVHPIEDIAELYALSIKNYGRNIAFIVSDDPITYKDFDTKVRSLMSSILPMPEDARILITTDNAFLFAQAYFAVVLSGKVAVLTNQPDIKSKINDTCHACLDDKIIKNLSSMEVFSGDLPSFDKHKLCTVLYTSGTINHPKGVIHSQYGIATNVVAGLEKMECGPGDRFLTLVPYSHVFGLVCDFLAVFYSGCTICVPKSKTAFFSELLHYNPSCLTLPPIVINAILQQIKARGRKTICNDLRWILCGGAQVSEDVAHEFQKYDIMVLPCYGLSEALGVCINSDIQHKGTSAGTPVNCNHLRIAEDGEVLICGTNVMLGYDGGEQPFVTIENKRYLKTGDLGYLDDDGFLYLTGRKDSLITLEDGTKCSPELFEEKILELKAVSDCIVSGMNGKLIATVVTDGTDDDFVKKQIMRFYLNEHHIHQVCFVSEIRKNILGKVIRHG